MHPESGHPSPAAAFPEGKHLVVLIHGIRTQGSWGEMVAAVLESTGPAEVLPIRYGYFDFFRFVCPLFTRRGPVRKILRELRDIRASHPTAKISVIAHSFGTYAIMKALQEREIILHRLLLCGAIIPESFRRADFRSQLGSDDVLNDCGTHDIWPPLAKSITWGYGATGTFGLGTVGVRDRYHKLGHSDYFNKDFVTRYWAPYIHEGRIEPTEWEQTRSTPPWWQSMLAWFPFKYLILALIGLAAWRAVLKFNETGELNLTLGDEILVGHYTGVPSFTERITITNSTRKEHTVEDFKLVLTGPDGTETLMRMTSISMMGQEMPPITMATLKPQSPFAYDYIFFNYSDALTTIHQEVISHIATTGIAITSPDESRALLPAPLVTKLQDFAKAQFIWKAGKWTATLTARAGDKKLKAERTFNLSQDEVDQMFRVTEHYKSGIGVFQNWRAVSFGNYQPYISKTANPEG